MSQIELSVLTALMAAAKDAVSNPATALILEAADVGSHTAVAQRDALVAAMRRRPSEAMKTRKEMQATPPVPSELAQLEIWSLYADHVDDPLLRGHLHHLLLDAGHGRRLDHVRSAACGYLDAAQLLAAKGGLVLPRAAWCLRTALELSLKFKQ